MMTLLLSPRARASIFRQRARYLGPMSTTSCGRPQAVHCIIAGLQAFRLQFGQIGFSILHLPKLAVVGLGVFHASSPRPIDEDEDGFAPRDHLATAECPPGVRCDAVLRFGVWRPNETRLHDLPCATVRRIVNCVPGENSLLPRQPSGYSTGTTTQRLLRLLGS